MHVNLLAIHHYARSTAMLRDRGVNHRVLLEDGAQNFVTQVRWWISGEGANPRFSEFMNAFVRRSDKDHASALARAMKHANISGAEATDIWERYRRCSANADKHQFVERYRNKQKATGAQ